MKKKYPLNKKYLVSFFSFIGLSYTLLAQCPSTIEVTNDPGQCTAVIVYGMPPSYSNLVVNPDASDELNGWEIGANGGSGWAADPALDAFVTSYSNCEKHQVINLEDAGYTAQAMDGAPDIYIAEQYKGTSVQTGDTYFLTVELRDENNDVIDSYATGNIITTADWQTASHVFSDYGPGVRSIYISHGGHDAEFWGGNYGSAMTNAQISIGGPVNVVEQTEGLPSGEAFPIGTTTNTFEMTSISGTETCSFDVNVIDEEAPTIFATNISLHMNEELEVGLTPEMFDTGSIDNCNVESYSIDVESLTCENIGDTEVTLTVTDVSGNSSTVVKTVTLTDPENYCQLSVENATLADGLTMYPNPTNGLVTLSSKNEVKTIGLYDMSGRLLKEININNTTYQLDLSAYASGTYFVKIANGKASLTKQILKK